MEIKLILILIFTFLDSCFLRKIPLIAGLLAPIAVILIFNLVIFVLVLRRLSAKVAGKSRRLKRKNDLRRRLMNAVCIMCLMGLTWSIGYLSVFSATSFFIQVLFCLLNSMQGYLLFMLYVVRQPEARSVWTSTFRFRSSSRFTQSSRMSNSLSASTGNNKQSRTSTGTPKPSRTSRPSAGQYGKPIDTSRLGYNNNGATVDGRILIVNHVNVNQPSAGNLNRGFTNIREEETDSGIGNVEGNVITPAITNGQQTVYF